MESLDLYQWSTKMDKVDFTYASRAEHNFAQRLLIKLLKILLKKKITEAVQKLLAK